MRIVGESLIDVVRGYRHSALVMQRYHLLKVLVVSTTTLNHYIRSANIIRKVVGQVHSLNKGVKVTGHGAKPRLCHSRSVVRGMGLCNGGGQRKQAKAPSAGPCKLL
jgi:hypothetical protein